MWSTVVYEEEKTSPCSRSKHTVSLLGNFLYLLGGRNGNVPLKDFWKYDLVNRRWELLRPSGDCPPCLQEHTAFTYRDNLYVFGGELGFSSGVETPLWIYESKKNVWKKLKGQKGSNVPKGRRGHTALVHRGIAFVYGGYCDLRGSSNQLWIFDFETESWHLITTGRNDPPARHKHSAVMHNDCLYIYGGMTDLQERSDLWRFDTVTKKWSTIKCKVNPGPLHSHIACKLPNSMILFGGERNGRLVNEFWRFHFGTETWQQIQTDVIWPQPISESCAVIISEMLLQTEEVVKNENSPPPPVVMRRQRTAVANQNREQRFAGAAAETKKRTNGDLFSMASPRITDFAYPSSAQGIMLPPRRQATTPNSCNISFLKEISKLSQMNLSRLAAPVAGRCSYHMLDSNESLNNLAETNIDDDDDYSRALTDRPVSRLKCSRSSSSNVLREVSSLVNTPLTPSDAAKLVYLEDEEAPVSLGEEFSSVHQKLHPSQNRSRRSYPLANSVRFANPLVTPEERPSPEITSDYASCENIHKLPSSSNNKLNGKTSSKDAVVSFSNPNYLATNPATATQQHMVYLEEKISRGDYVKLNSPADSLLEDSIEMTELRPKPPKTLPLINDNDRMNNGFLERRKKYRACSAGRYENQRFTSVCVFLVGGKDQCTVTSFRKPISIWKLSLTKDVH